MTQRMSRPREVASMRAQARRGFDQDLARYIVSARAIGEPIHNRTAEEISMAKLFALLFEVTGLFDMRTRPELLLRHAARAPARAHGGCGYRRRRSRRHDRACRCRKARTQSRCRFARRNPSLPGGRSDYRHAG